MSNLVHNNNVIDPIKNDNLVSSSKKKKNRKKRKKRSKKDDNNNATQILETTPEPDQGAKKLKSDDKETQEISLLPFLKNIPSLLVSDVEDITLPVSQNIENENATASQIQEIEEGEIINQIEDKENQPRKSNSNKKSKKLKSKTPVCKKWIVGKCYKKEECPFLHQGEQIKSSEICKFYRTGSCSRGDKCLYSHDLKSEACKFLAIRGACGKGDECPYSHDPELIKKAIQMNQEKEKERKELESQSQIPKEISNHLINFQYNSIT